MRSGLQTIVITGLSGAGKTTALHAVEDLGIYCVDNLPLPLLDALIETIRQEPAVDSLALVVDVRLGHYIGGYARALETLRAQGQLVEVIYLDARDEVLLQRFSQTRRRHPLGGADVRAGIARERELLRPLRARAAWSIDTTEMTVHELKRIVQERYRSDEAQEMLLSLVSFGFRHGPPGEADLLFDVRFLPNPHFVEELRPLTGKDERVAEFVMQQPDSVEFVERALDWLEFLLPRYRAEGKAYLTMAVGCTGGKHRSVALVEALAGRLRERGQAVSVRHRDLSRRADGPEDVARR